MAKLYFNVLYPKRKLNQTDEARINISSSGTMSIRAPAMNLLGLDETKPFYIKLFSDTLNKALGFQVEKLEGSLKKKETGWRVVKPISPKAGRPFAMLSIKNFTSELHGITLPATLAVKTYKDLLMGNIHYIQFGNGVARHADKE